MSGVAFPLRALRRPHLLRSLQPLGSTARRSLHERSALNYRLEKGLGDFMSPAALRTVAVDYQQGLLGRLNEEVKGGLLRVQSHYVYSFAGNCRDGGRVYDGR